ncbi:hypothetical protein U9M48_028874 [Paspalum notatum var. saurae]|uniref:Uncharacterized protein n=1 Tax=Paspalum notatum var. saurae TaxID=547442 RepID=A0AAQ3X0Z6_PASNO
MAADLRMATVFGEAKTDDEADAPPHRPVLFRAHVHAQGQGLLRVVATDLHSLAWHRSLDIDALRDLQDDVGIAGSWSDFLDYLCSSLSSGQVSLRFPAAPQEQERVSQLMETLASERVGYIPSSPPYVLVLLFMLLLDEYKWEKNEVMQKQLEALSFLDKRKSTKPKLGTDQVPSVSVPPPSSDQVVIPAQQKTSVASPARVPTAKATKRVAPAPRRARVRGALLQDTEENDDI